MLAAQFSHPLLLRWLLCPFIVVFAYLQGWGSIEYGTVGFTGGQVIGGRWKPLQYYYKQHLYTDLFVVCGNDARCLVKNDSPLHAFSGTLVLSLLHVGTSKVSELARKPVALAKGAGQ